MPINLDEAEDQSRLVVGFDLPKVKTFGTKASTSVNYPEQTFQRLSPTTSDYRVLQLKSADTSFSTHWVERTAIKLGL